MSDYTKKGHWKKSYSIFTLVGYVSENTDGRNGESHKTLSGHNDTHSHQVRKKIKDSHKVVCLHVKKKWSTSCKRNKG